jgi:hypothetical protein
LQRALRLLRTPAVTALILTAAPGCQASIDAFGPSPDAARRLADAVFAGFAYRFYNVQRQPRFDRARRRMARGALTPSELYSDSSIWTRSSDRDSSRTLSIRAGYENASYYFAPAVDVPTPANVGDERSEIRLSWLRGADYEWTTSVEHAVGTAPPAALAQVITATLTAFEGRTGQAALAHARATFPATTRHLAQLFTVDSLATTEASGATTATLGIRLRPDSARARYYFLAGWVERYLIPSIYRIRVTDRSGATFADIAARDGRITVRLRSKDRQLVSLEGAPRPLPDTLVLHAEYTARYRIFRVGFSGLQGEFTLERSPTERAWQFRFKTEPAWHFPLATRHLIRKPLRRPFEGRGIEFRLGIEAGESGQTLSTRRTRLAVSESAIMRWLGGLGNAAFGSLSGRVEREQNLFLYELFAALRVDIGANRH